MTTRDSQLKPAEDCVEQLTEASRFLDAADHALLAALLDGVDLTGAAESAVVLIARARGFLDRALVVAA
jgi:hypothetical protein